MVRSRSEPKPRSGYGGARTRTEACFEHAGAEKAKGRYPAGITKITKRGRYIL